MSNIQSLSLGSVVEIVEHSPHYVSHVAGKPRAISERIRLAQAALEDRLLKTGGRIGSLSDPQHIREYLELKFVWNEVSIIYFITLAGQAVFLDCEVAERNGGSTCERAKTSQPYDFDYRLVASCRYGTPHSQEARGWLGVVGDKDVLFETLAQSLDLLSFVIDLPGASLPKNLPGVQDALARGVITWAEARVSAYGEMVTLLSSYSEYLSVYADLHKIDIPANWRIDIVKSAAKFVAPLEYQSRYRLEPVEDRLHSEIVDWSVAGSILYGSSLVSLVKLFEIKSSKAEMLLREITINSVKKFARIRQQQRKSLKTIYHDNCVEEIVNIIGNKRHHIQIPEIISEYLIDFDDQFSPEYKEKGRYVLENLVRVGLSMGHDCIESPLISDRDNDLAKAIGVLITASEF